MRYAVRLSTALGLLTFLLAVHPAASRANCPPLGANQLCYDQPAINQTATNTSYTFPAGSHVSIQANGCDQTGGSGETWKRYVNPDPWASPTQFHGKAGIYSKVGGPTTLATTRILNISPSTSYRVTSLSYLQVGFEDDDYSDNNYDSHDDGNGQCAWTTTGSPVSGTYYNTWGYSGPAYILLTVTPDAAPSVTANQPAAYVSGTTTFSGSASDNDGDSLTYQWILDGNAVPGVAGTSFNWSSAAVGDGSHTIALKASDPYTSTTSAARTFSVDNTSPTVSITSGPSNQTFGPGSTQTWTFGASDGAGSGIQGVQCRIDAAPVTCSGASSHTVSNLPNGTHTFSVQATDRVGHVSSVSRTFAIDATPPETTITSGPDEGASTTDTTITYAVASSEQGSSFLCRHYLDQPAPLKPSFTACSGGNVDVLSNLSPAAYVFEAYATDAHGNADPTPVVRHFTVTAPPPPDTGSGGGGTTTGGGGTTTGGGGGATTAGGGGTTTGGGGTTSGGGGTTTGSTPTTTSSTRPRPRIRAKLVYANISPTRLTKLTLKHVPRGSTVRVTCRGRCPKGLHKRYTKRHVSGSLSLTRLVRRGLKPGVRLTIVVSKPGWRSMTKTVSIRRGKPPKVR